MSVVGNRPFPAAWELLRILKSGRETGDYGLFHGSTLPCKTERGRFAIEKRVYGYIRVSSKDQNEDRQLIALREAGAVLAHSNRVEKKMSGQRNLAGHFHPEILYERSHGDQETDALFFTLASTCRILRSAKRPIADSGFAFLLFFQ